MTAAEIPPGLLPPGAPFENPFRGNKPELDPVPTGVAAGPDGTLYVANLSGFPYVAGKAKVLRVTPGGALSEAATGLTMAVSVAFGPDGLLYVSQIATGFQLTGPDTPPTISPGAVVRVRPNGAKEAVLGDLNAPSGIAWSPAAEKRLENIPDFIRPMARKEVERIAQETGATLVTESMMDQAKTKFMNFM